MRYAVAMRESFKTSETKRRALRRNKLFASGLLLAAVVLFLVIQLIPEPGFAARLTAAAAEAAIVGGLADWFAVTALFRHPLGLPIPHTALIPSRKNEIARSLGDFVKDQFLDPGLVIARLRAENRALQLARWLDSDAAATFMAQRVVDLVPPLLKGANDADVRRFIGNLAGEAIHRVDFIAIFDGALASLIASGKHMEFADAIADVVGPAVQALKQPIVEKVGERTGRFFPSYFDRKIGQGIVAGFESWLIAIRRPESDERRKLDGWIITRVAEFRASPDYRKLLEEAQAAILASPAVIHGLEAIWDAIKREILEDAASDAPQLGAATAQIVRTIGRLLQQMPAMQDYVNAAIELVVVDYIAPWRRDISNFIAEVVESWDGPKVAEIIELEVGRDLQYIRINGTLVGALIGMLLFLIGAGIPSFSSAAGIFGL